MRAIHFDVQGAQGLHRTYYDFYVGFGFFVPIFVLSLAVFAWPVGGMRPEILASIPQVTWSLAICCLAITVLSWKYFFAAPIHPGKAEFSSRSLVRRKGTGNSRKHQVKGKKRFHLLRKGKGDRRSAALG
jgi:hypothetical protein